MCVYSCPDYCCCLTGQIFQITQHSAGKNWVFADLWSTVLCRTDCVCVCVRERMCLGLCLCEKITDNQGQSSAMNATDFTEIIERRIRKRWNGRKCSKGYDCEMHFFFFFNWKRSVMKDLLWKDPLCISLWVLSCLEGRYFSFSRIVEIESCFCRMAECVCVCVYVCVLW